MRVCIISGLGMVKSHGTGAQLLRLFDASNTPFFHFYFTSWHYGKSVCDNSFALEEPAKWPWYRGRRFMARLERFLKISWWDGNNAVRAVKLQAFLKSHDLKADVAYVIVASEDEAQRAVSLLQHLQCPYVVHLMDLVHQQGLIPEAMPGLSSTAN